MAWKKSGESYRELFISRARNRRLTRLTYEGQPCRCVIIKFLLIPHRRLDYDLLAVEYNVSVNRFLGKSFFVTISAILFDGD